MNIVEIFVIRIYRRATGNSNRVEGVVEIPLTNESRAFRTKEEAVRMIFDRPGLLSSGTNAIKHKPLKPGRKR